MVRPAFWPCWGRAFRLVCLLRASMAIGSMRGGRGRLRSPCLRSRRLRAPSSVVIVGCGRGVTGLVLLLLLLWLLWLWRVVWWLQLVRFSLAPARYRRTDVAGCEGVTWRI